jgi:hypothetical protein
MRTVYFLKNRGRPFTVFAMSLVTLFLFVVSISVHAPSTGMIGLVLGVVLILGAIPLHLLGRKTHIGYILCIIVNAWAMGACAGAYFDKSGISVEISSLLPSIVPSIIIIFAIAICMVSIPQRKMAVTVIFALVEILFIVMAIIFWVKFGAEYYALEFFSLLIVGFYTVILAVTVNDDPSSEKKEYENLKQAFLDENEDKRSVLRDVSIGSLGAFIAVSVVALVLVAGDGLDCDCGCDSCDCGTGGKTKKPRK